MSGKRGNDISLQSHRSNTGLTISVPFGELEHLRRARESQAAIEDVRRVRQGQFAAVTDGSGNSVYVTIAEIRPDSRGAGGLVRFAIARVCL